MGRRDESGFGKLKLLLAFAQPILAVIGGVAHLSDEGHAILATLVFAFFAVYVVADMLW